MNKPENYLENLANSKMPFGRYKNRYLIDLPEYYLIWYRQKGFPKNKLGMQMQEVLELKMNGLEHLLKKLKTTKHRQ